MQGIVRINAIMLHNTLVLIVDDGHVEPFLYWMTVILSSNTSIPLLISPLGEIISLPLLQCFIHNHMDLDYKQSNIYKFCH
jgi:hypothetical protein